MRDAQDKYNSGMENQISNLRDLLTTRYDATINENQIQISPDQLECYVQDMAQLLAENKREDISAQTTYESGYRSVFPPLFENGRMKGMWAGQRKVRWQ